MKQNNYGMEEKTKMKSKLKSKLGMWLLAAVIAVAAAVGAPGLASAVNTPHGTTISNTATIDYLVGGVAQTPIVSAAATFTVDQLVSVTSVSDTAFVTTYPGSSAIALKFTVSNLSNQNFTATQTQDFAVSVLADVANPAGWTTAIYEDDPAGIAGTYEPGVDDPITYIDELAANTGTKVVYIVATPPLTAVNGDLATYALKVVARDGGAAAVQGAVTVATVGPDNTATPDIVLGDGDGDAAGADDANYDGIYVQWAGGTAGNGGGTRGYKVSAASLTITKTSAVVWDPVNLGVNPKAIPGARVEYTVTIANGAGAADATNVTVSDSIPANTTFYTDGYAAVKGMQVTAPNLYGGAATALTNLADADEGTFAAATVTVNGMIVTANQSATVKFQVTID